MTKTKNKNKKESKTRKSSKQTEEDKHDISKNINGIGSSSAIFKLDLNFTNDFSLSSDLINDNEDPYDI